MSPDPVALAESRLRWLDRRQAVLARNVANADTPRYRPHDLPAFANALRTTLRTAGLSPARTDPSHLASTRAADPRARAARATEAAPDGNAVALDEQALKIAETDSAHALAMNLHRRWTGLFRAALGRNG